MDIIVVLPSKTLPPQSILFPKTRKYTSCIKCVCNESFFFSSILSQSWHAMKIKGFFFHDCQKIMIDGFIYFQCLVLSVQCVPMSPDQGQANATVVKFPKLPAPMDWISASPWKGRWRISRRLRTSNKRTVPTTLRVTQLATTTVRT